MVKGTVKWFNDEKGFGFIAGNNGQDYFVHWSDIVSTGFKKLTEEQEVDFEPVNTSRGWKAANVCLV